jgi:alpha-beta hydrolase superfamily lysophospholipase
MPVPAFPSASEAKHEEGFLHSADHVRLHWQRYTPPGTPRATVAVIHGGGDHSGRYPALVTALVGAGFQAGLVDLRGHGQSDGRRWYVDAFSDYLRDVDGLVAKLRADAPPGGKLFVVGHSMGALAAIHWALERPGAAAGYVLSSPYLVLAFPPPTVKLLAAKTLGRVLPRSCSAGRIATRSTGAPRRRAGSTKPGALSSRRSVALRSSRRPCSRSLAARTGSPRTTARAA